MSNRRPQVCVIGSLNMDLVMRTPRFAAAGETLIGGPFASYPGGKGANQAVAAARLGAAVSFVGAVGDDAYGREFRSVLKAEGIDCTHLTIKQDAATGVGMIFINKAGENAIVVSLGANLSLSPRDVDAAMDVILAADVIMLQLEIPPATIEHVLARSDDFKAVITLNAAPAQRISEGLLALVDVLVVNEIEARAQVTESHGRLPPESLIASIPCCGQTVKVMTLAERGAMTCFQGDHIRVHPAFAVSPVDTVGAGDAFCGALAVMISEDRDWLGNEDYSHSIRFANAAGALAVTKHGAIPSLPTRAEVNAFLHERAKATHRI